MAKTRNKDIAGIRVLTPPIDPGTKHAASANAGTGAGRTAGGSGGGRNAATAYTFDDFHRTTRAAYEPAQVEIEAFDREKQAASLSAWLRPNYDRAIADREQRTDTARAELDADALSRNMGTSAYVTDVKSRMHTQEARDVATLEAEYGAEVERYLIEMEQSYLARRNETEMFNAGEWNDAMQKAYDSAMTLYRNYLSSRGRSGGGGTGKTGRTPSLLDFDKQTQLETGRWAWERVAAPDKEAVYEYLGVLCTPEERDQIYYGNSPLYANIRAEMLKTLGTLGTRQAHWDLPGNETYPTYYK